MADQGRHHDTLTEIRDIVSTSWLYPFKGVYYFLTHREFWPLFQRRLIPLTILSVVVLGFLFTFAYLPQVAFLAIFHGPAAFFNAAILVLGEGQIIIALLFEAFLIDETCVNVFDATLISRGYKDLVSPVRILFHDAPNPVKMLGKPTASAIYSPFSFRQIFECIVFLPINFIPIVGVFFYLLLTGARGGPLHHYRYFKLRGCTRKEKKEEIRKRGWSYTWFGTVALCLQLVPVLSMFFLLSTPIGSALWAVNLEEQKKRVRDADVSVQREAHNQDIGQTVVDEEAPPPYTDDSL
ncbi:uncharacterized protein LY89DRAFT_588684 [Mollisia scopiformis]|uniref:Uncharacterized protein n=1 Tax=Mollisia scopiformis TaxID=149040 RepID=A0A194X489_MOLSC|nr:uncharacterized protein LY89DRAFT_588684 [Mollisia scopiformis]KUJ14990.1 hypothetical protein LY89DRAFT_588684 [Mollisia scopiformis]